MKKIIMTIAAFSCTIATYAQTNYTLDKNHTRVGFSATHFGISHVEGRFKNITATLVSKKDDFMDASIEMTADMNSIDTDIEMRDNDLRSDNWFDATKYPSLIFKSSSFKKVNENNYKLTGNITIHGVTKPITFDVVYNGKVLNPMTKKSSVGFTISGELNRTDFSVGSEGGPVGNQIKLLSNTEFIID